MCDAAADNGLGIDLTFFTGHMSGPNWTPRWLSGGPLPPHTWIRQVVSDNMLIDNGYRNMFHDPTALDASRMLLKTIVTRLHQHPGIWMWNLGNEPDLFAWPDSPAAGQAWVHEMTALIKSIDPHHPSTRRHRQRLHHTGKRHSGIDHVARGVGNEEQETDCGDDESREEGDPVKRM